MHAPCVLVESYYGCGIYFSLIQIELGCLPMSEFSLNQDTSRVFRTASRITKCKSQASLVEWLLTACVRVYLYVNVCTVWGACKYVVVPH